MRNLTLILLFTVGLESFSLAFDIPPPPKPIVAKPADAPALMSQTGIVVGGAALATALLVGGLWISRKRKMNQAG